MNRNSVYRIAGRLMAFVFGAIDARRLALFEKGFALTLFAYVCERSRHAYEWLTANGFHFSGDAQSWWMPPPAPLLPAWAVPAFLTVYLGTILFFVLGVQRRATVLIVWGCTIYVSLADTAAAFTINILYIVTFAVLAAAPPSQQDVDDAGTSRAVNSAWPVRALQSLLLLQYTTAGWCKVVHGDWLTNNDVLWSQVQGLYRTDAVSWMLRHLPQEFWTASQWFALGFECFGPVLFLHRRTLPIGILAGIGFHSIIALTMYNLVFFSAQMACFYLLFSWTHGETGPRTTVAN